jgi:hypothetical protein
MFAIAGAARCHLVGNIHEVLMPIDAMFAHARSFREMKWNLFATEITENMKQVILCAANNPAMSAGQLK